VANRRITELQVIAGTSLAEDDLFTVVHVGEVDPTLKNRRLTFSGTKQYLDIYYLPRTGGTVSGAVVVQGDLTVSGSTNFTAAAFTGVVTVGSLVAQSGITASGTISGATITGANVQGTNVNGVLGNFTTITGQTINVTSGNFLQKVSGVTITGTSGGFVTLNSTTGNFTSITGVTITGTTITAATGIFSTLTYTGVMAGTSISVGNTSATVTDTGTDGKFTVVTEGNTALTISAQATLFGAGFTTALNYYSVSASTQLSSMDSNYIAGGGGNNPAGPLLWSYGNTTAASACELTFLRTKSNASTDLTGQTTANDALGYVNFIGTDGTNTRPCASFQAYSEIAILSASSPGRLVFGTTTAGTTVISEKLRITNGGTIAYNQPTPTSKSAAATLTVSELQTGIIEYTGAAATLTLPTGTLTEGGFAGIYTNMAFQWSVINTGSGICTIGAGTAHTIVGSATIAIGASAQFASRRTAANTFVSYRLS